MCCCSKIVRLWRGGRGSPRCTPSLETPAQQGPQPGGRFCYTARDPPAPHHRLEQCSCCSSIQLTQQHGSLPAALASALLLPRLPTSPFHFRFKLDQEQVARSGSHGGVRRTLASLGVGGRLDGYVVATTASAPPPGNTNSETIEARQLLDGGHGHIQVREAALVFQLGLAIRSGRTLRPPSSFFCGEGIEKTSPVWILTLFRAVPSDLRAQTGAVSSTGHLRYPLAKSKWSIRRRGGRANFMRKHACCTSLCGSTVCPWLLVKPLPHIQSKDGWSDPVPRPRGLSSLSM